jgi:pimeloyl-ACP methyl ester carboxylesterase
MNQRRTFMQGVAGAVGGAVAGASLTACGGSNAAESPNVSYLLVHGAWHTSQCWNLVSARLTAAGKRVYAIDLPGAGLHARFPKSYLAQDAASLVSELSPLKDIGLQDYEDAAVAQVRAMAGSNGKVVLVGHSFGGCTITRIAEKVPELVHRLVYLTAHVPAQRKTVFDLMGLPEGATGLSATTQIGDPTVTGAVRINNRNADPAYVEKCRQCFYNDVPTADFIPFAATLMPDVSLKGFLDNAAGTPERWGRLPRSYIRCTLDNAIPIALQDRFIAEADAITPGNKFDLHTLVASHSPFASMPAELTAILLKMS